MAVRSLSRMFLATLIVAVCFACVGCGGGGGGGSSSAVTPAYLKVPTLTATVPASGGGSVRTSVRALPAPVASEFSVALLNPETGETLTTITAISASISGVNHVINFGNNITVAAPSKGVLKMVITRLNVAIMRGYISSAVPAAGETKTMDNVDIGSDDLAKALAFEEWQARYVAGTFDNFVNQVMNETTFSDKLDTLIEKVETTLITLVTTTPSSTFTWEGVSEVAAVADDFQDVAAPPTTGGVGIPANIQIEGFVASPATQVRCAIESILNLANIGMPSRINASVAPTNPAVPALTPILGTNQAIDIKGMQNLLMVALQGGTAATESPIGNLESWDGSEISYTASSVEVILKRSYLINNSTIGSQKIGRQLIEGAEITAADGAISQIKFNANTKFTNETINPDTNEVTNRLMFRFTNGITGVASYQKVATTGRYISEETAANYPSAIGMAYTHKGYQKEEVTISGPATIEVDVDDVRNGVKAGGTLTLSGVTGSYSETRGFYVGDDGEFHFYGEEIKDENTLTFSGNALSIGMTAESTTNDVYLKALNLTLTGITKITSGVYEGAYKVSGISGTVVAAYNGTSYKDYGYIKQLEITIANASFDPSAAQQIPDGATVTLKKTNSDNTTDMLTYTITNGKPVLSGSTNFQGGSATVSTTDGNVKFTGTITFQDPTAKKMVMAYEAMYTNTPETKESITATATLTIDGSTTRIVTYTYYPTDRWQTENNVDMLYFINNGLYMNGNKTILGNFAWYQHYGNWQQGFMSNTVYSNNIADWQNFVLEK